MAAHEKYSPGIAIRYKKIRDISTVSEIENGASTHIMVVDAKEIMKIGTEDNVRDYIPGSNPRKRTMVHRAIEDTIKNRPDRFTQMNSGFLIGASSVEIDDKDKVAYVWNASINNGAQSQGEIARFFESLEEGDNTSFDVRVELSVEPDESIRTDIAIARNTMNNVADVSQAGARNYFEEIDASFRKKFPNLSLARSETDSSEEFIDTRQLLRVLWTLIPDELLTRTRNTSTASKRVSAYVSASMCLKNFKRVHDAVDIDPVSAATYKYFVDMAGPAWEIYERWRRNTGLKNLRSSAGQVTRSDEGQIAADGIVFPVLAALSVFVRQDKKGNWCMQIPKEFRDEQILQPAREALKNVANGSPIIMGRSSAIYENLMMATRTVVRLIDEIGRSIREGK